MNSKLLYFVILSYCFILNTAAQTKNEREERVKISEFPEIAQKAIEALPKHCKRIKFYKETDGEKQSFEAKFKYRKQHFSLEFSKDGLIEDIEVITQLKHIEEASKKNIETYFKQDFNSYKYIKIQKQYVFDDVVKTSQFINNVLSNATDIIPNFEIIAEVKVEKQRDIREFTFDNTGSFLNFRVLNPTSYEHVLY